MATLKEYFDADFNTVPKINNSLPLTSASETINCIVQAHFDFDANAKFLSVFIPKCDYPVDACRIILGNQKQILSKLAEGVEVVWGSTGERLMNSQDLILSGRVFIYSESSIEEPALDALQKEAKNNGIILQFRGPTYSQKRSELEKPLAFISHDFRDKDEIARPIALGLIKLMKPVWFDEYSLKVGDRLRESIERGIKECNKCVLILSPNFLSNSGWTKTEFNSIFTRELIEGSDFLLPVWCGVDKKEIFEYSPSLVDRVGVNWNLGVDEVVKRLSRSINP